MLAHPQYFWFGENPGKICWNLGKMLEYLRKIAVYALISQKSTDLFLLEVLFLFSSFRASWGNLGKNGAWRGLIWKNTPNMSRNAVVFLFLFFEVIFLWVFFGQICGSLGKNPLHLQKFACSYTMFRVACHILTCYFSGVFICNLWFLLIVPVNVVSCRVTP